MLSILAWISVLAVSAPDSVAGTAGSVRPLHQWQPCELVFQAAADCADPFDPAVDFHAVFTGPQGARLTIPGFWDGDRTWKIRFTPTAAGTWEYRTSSANRTDRGLHDRQGRLAVQPPTNETLLRRHGGFLRVSDNRRYLTYSDGTPFFWLGDTWWQCPSAYVPLAQFKRLVDLRAKQGYTVFQAHGHRALRADGPSVFEAVATASPQALAYWREVDQYFAYAEEKGLLGVMGFAGHALLDPIGLQDLKRLWRYYLARYGAYPITFLITQEYNANIGKLQQRLPKLLALGQFIHDVDPYRRAMSVHPWTIAREQREAWNEPWHDFIMLQAGHRVFTNVKRYGEFYAAATFKPMIESEGNYEGFVGKDFPVDAAAVRRTAYSAIQAGCCGFTYGAQGLYAGVQDKAEPFNTPRWGPVLTWEEGLMLPGGAQMQHLRACYESLAWWRLEPCPDAVPGTRVLVKAEGQRALLLYFLAGDPPANARLARIPPGNRYHAAWFDPRNGQKTVVSEPLTADAQGLPLPAKPDKEDWVLLLTSSSPRP